MLRASLICLAGCATSGCADWGQITGTTAQMCKSWLPVYPSRADKLTKGTETQIAGNNASNETWCGSRPPVKSDPRIASAEPQKDAKP